MSADNFQGKLICGNASHDLATRVASLLGVELLASSVGQFKNGETMVKVDEEVADEHIFIIQSTGKTVSTTSRGRGTIDGVFTPNDLLMEVFAIANACRLASAKRITAVIPCLGYSRQDRIVERIEPITLKLVAELLEVAGVDDVITVDIHCEQTIGFFSKAHNIPSAIILAKGVSEMLVLGEDVTVVSPDAGGVKRAKCFQLHLESSLGRGTGFAVINKERMGAGKIKKMVLLEESSDGGIKDKTCVIVDDIGDTCGTICRAASCLKEKGASCVIAVLTHPVFSENAMERLISCEDIDRVFVTDTLSIPETEGSKITIVTIDYLLATSMWCLLNGTPMDKICNVGALDKDPVEVMEHKLNHYAKKSIKSSRNRKKSNWTSLFFTS